MQGQADPNQRSNFIALAFYNPNILSVLQIHFFL